MSSVRKRPQRVECNKDKDKWNKFKLRRQKIKEQRISQQSVKVSRKVEMLKKIKHLLITKTKKIIHYFEYKLIEKEKSEKRRKISKIRPHIFFCRKIDDCYHSVISIISKDKFKIFFKLMKTYIAINFAYTSIVEILVYLKDQEHLPYIEIFVYIGELINFNAESFINKISSLYEMNCLTSYKVIVFYLLLTTPFWILNKFSIKELMVKQICILLLSSVVYYKAGIYKVPHMLSFAYVYIICEFCIQCALLCIKVSENEKIENISLCLLRLSTVPLVFLVLYIIMPLNFIDINPIVKKVMLYTQLSGFNN